MQVFGLHKQADDINCSFGVFIVNIYQICPEFNRFQIIPKELLHTRHPILGVGLRNANEMFSLKLAIEKIRIFSVKTLKILI